MSSVIRTEETEVVVIGAGQTGLSVGYHLKRLGIPFVMLEANARVGDTWRKRWDSLRLFTPARYDGLVGMLFPASRFAFPTKDEMADYLESYAKTFDLPVETGVTVNRLWKRDGRFVVSTGSREIEARQVVVAMANYQNPVVPAFAKALSADITQLHSSAYQNPRQLRDGPVLVVGAGNSGAEIGMELARLGRSVMLSGRGTGHLPWRIDSVLAQRILTPLVLRFVFHRVLTTDTPMGRKAKPVGLPAGGPLLRIKPKDLTDVGVQRLPRVAGVKDGAPILDDGRSVIASNIIWCTGFEPGFSWIDLAVFDERRQPIHRRGVVASEPGLYFAGLHFLYSMSSTMIHGAARDAAHIANEIARARPERNQFPTAPRSLTGAA